MKFKEIDILESRLRELGRFRAGFEKEKGIESYIAWDTAGFYKYVIIIKDGIDYYFDSSAYVLYEGYEDARLKCLEKLIEIYEKL